MYMCRGRTRGGAHLVEFPVAVPRPSPWSPAPCAAARGRHVVPRHDDPLHRRTWKQADAHRDDLHLAPSHILCRGRACPTRPGSGVPDPDGPQGRTVRRKPMADTDDSGQVIAARRFGQLITVVPAPGGAARAGHAAPRHNHPLRRRTWHQADVHHAHLHLAPTHTLCRGQACLTRAGPKGPAPEPPSVAVTRHTIFLSS